MLEKLSDKLDNMDYRLQTLEHATEIEPQAEAQLESDNESVASVTPVPVTLAQLQTNKALQAQVESRLRELGVAGDSGSEEDDGKSKMPGKRNKIKSGRVRTAADVARIPMEWPHYHVYRGPDRKPAHYDDLSVPEFIMGYMTILLDSPDINRDMLMHLRDVMTDTVDYSWDSARNSHAVLLQQMEQGRITWQDRTQVQEVRRRYAQTNGPTLHQSRDTRGPQFCVRYQDGRCTLEDGHSTVRGPVRHVCAFCLRCTGNTYRHAEGDCNRKNATQAKNYRASRPLSGQEI